MTALITANEGQVEACREFIRKYCDPEYLQIYDIYWAGNDPRRMEKISELQTEDEMKFKAIEAEEFAQDGLDAYTGIGQMYSSYVGKDSEENRGEENNERSQI